MAEVPEGGITWHDLQGWCGLATHDFPKMLVQLRATEDIPDSDSIMRCLADKGCGIQFKVPLGDVDRAPAQQRQQHVRTHIVWEAVKPRKLR